MNNLGFTVVLAAILAMAFVLANAVERDAKRRDIEKSWAEIDLLLRKDVR